jgi:hypothetical protein
MRALQKGATRRHSVLVRALGHADCPNLYSRNPADIRADRRQCAALGWRDPVTARDDSHLGSRGDQQAMRAGDAAIPAWVTGAPLVLASVRSA